MQKNHPEFCFHTHVNKNPPAHRMLKPTFSTCFSLLPSQITAVSPKCISSHFITATCLLIKTYLSPWISFCLGLLLWETMRFFKHLLDTPGSRQLWGNKPIHHKSLAAWKILKRLPPQSLFKKGVEEPHTKIKQAHCQLSEKLRKVHRMLKPTANCKM